jgi:hypothetical protein
MLCFLNAPFSVAFFHEGADLLNVPFCFSSKMSMASALTNHWVVGGSSHHEYKSTRSDDCFKVLTWNHNVIKGKQFLPREKVALTGWQITRAVPKDPKKVISL